MRWAPLSVLLLVAPLAACGGDGGADADALCERPTINGIEDQFVDDGLDFEEARDSLAVVRAAAEGDLDDEVDALVEATELADEGLEGVDLDDEDEVDEALNEALEDVDESIFEDIEDVLRFVDDECDTELAAPADGEDEEDAIDPVELALEDLCADDTIDTLEFLFDGGPAQHDFDAERDALDLIRTAADGDLDDEVDLLLVVVDVFEDADDIDDADERDAAIDEALVDELSPRELEELGDVNDDVKAFVDDECGSELADEPSGDDDPVVEDDDPGTAGDASLEDFADLVESCEDGDMADCDELFFVTPVGSAAEDVGRTCGGVGDETTAGRCEELFG